MAENKTCYASVGENLIVVRTIGNFHGLPIRGYRKGTITDCNDGQAVILLTKVLFRITKTGGISGVNQEYIIYDDGYYSIDLDINPLFQKESEKKVWQTEVKNLFDNAKKLKFVKERGLDGFEIKIFLDESEEAVATAGTFYTAKGDKDIHSLLDELLKRLINTPELVK